MCTWVQKANEDKFWCSNNEELYAIFVLSNVLKTLQLANVRRTKVSKLTAPAANNFLLAKVTKKIACSKWSPIGALLKTLVER